MEIAIVGAGISGLSQYLFFRKLGLTDIHSIVIFEARQIKPGSSTGEQNAETYNASVIGASIGLSSTGLKVLKRLDPDLYDEVLQSGHVITSWKLSSSRGWTLAEIPAGGEDEMTVMIGRDAFWKILRKRVPDEAIQRRKVVDVELAHDASGSRLVFEEGSTERFDLVVSADGIWSIGRRAFFGGQGKQRYEYSPHYEGLIGTGGFVTSSLLQNVPDGQMNVVNGGNGFFGYGYCSSSDVGPRKHGDTATWWSTHSLRDCPDDWRHIDLESVKSELQRRHSEWKDPVVQSIVRDVRVDSLYPTFTTPLLPTWQKGCCVLVGDAAHALQPSSGQGASMALEDCETLALLLHHYLTVRSSKSIQRALEQYSDIRRPRLAMVHKKAQELAGMKQDMSLLEEMVMYFFIWLFARLSLNEAYQKKLNHYDVPTVVETVLRGTS
ncbi:hypothetical protein M409DRAFT_19623 [Zasmidium cellare ATCC 36951]|uniref:FAD-binding domain-containing protein n=1 Tax=Zasmidium cellare ATCC 36951 TaxID=1080233 RepID=A0A6A6CUZ4_ZASCE|nr:uncharacterized protein M409DRAFT_19623 [Zasmidium cellare ATCC 36951]KAF2170010.1 hypothetical protein M409DRAFT_19623 [Zasmidium cellare ATCC 36951]